MRTATSRYQAGRPARRLVIRTLSAGATAGWLEWGHVRFRCALGRSGISRIKREGDGATPAGAWPVRHAYFRQDRLRLLRAGISVRALAPADGWCDEPADRNYNRHVRHPYPASAEHMWRADGLYDVVVVLGYNDAPRIKGAGSAIFLHCARQGFTPTQGCIALARRDLVCLMPRLTRKTTILIA